MELLTLIKFHLFYSDELDNIPEALLSYDGVREKVTMAKELWLNVSK